MLFSRKKHIFDDLGRELRLEVLEMIYKNGGHIGGCLSSIDMMIGVYFSDIFDLKKDKFILSAGHWAPALDAVLAESGFFDKKLLEDIGEFGSKLQGHVNTETPGVEYSSGSLGQGLAFALGEAMGDRSKNIICMTSDGEQNEGMIWETVNVANKYQLNNLINIVDVNGMQIDGSTDEIMPLLSLQKKYEASGWMVIKINGHNYFEIVKALEQAKKSKYPCTILAETILGKGIKEMEGKYQYHDVKKLDEEVYKKAKEELSK
jgi:transketolase